MRFAVILHGPEVLDTGLGQEAVRLLEERGQVVAVMSGITGVAAVVDAGLEARIDISRRRKPSVELLHMDKEADYLLLVNCAKNRGSALRFGSIVYSRCGSRLTKPFIQVDDGLLIDWSGEGGGVAEALAAQLGLEVLRPGPREPPKPEGGWRRIGGVIPGENVWVNGVVVGRATSEEVMIGTDADGRLLAQGMSLKQTGVNRLGRFDVRSAHVRSGVTRRTSALPRAITSRKSGIYLVDHSAEEAVYRCRDASLVITVGDDTSKIAGALLYRFDVPTVAIIDGDEDGISTEQLRKSGSVVIRVRPGTDDLVGAEVRESLFHGKDRLEGAMTPEEAARTIAALAGDRLMEHLEFAKDDDGKERK